MIGLVLVLAATLWPQSMAQSGCTSTLVSLMPCLGFITGNSSTPSSSCCSQLASVVQASPRCLCLVMNGTGPMFGIPINQTLALALPNACNVQTPPVSQCNGKSLPLLHGETASIRISDGIEVKHVEGVLDAHLNLSFCQLAREANLSREENSFVDGSEWHEHVHLLDVSGETREVLVTKMAIDEDIALGVSASLSVAIPEPS